VARVRRPSYPESRRFDLLGGYLDLAKSRGFDPLHSYVGAFGTIGRQKYLCCIGVFKPDRMAAGVRFTI
jgi:hypothetical protein